MKRGLYLLCCLALSGCAYGWNPVGVHAYPPVYEVPAVGPHHYREHVRKRPVHRVRPAHRVRTGHRVRPAHRVRTVVRHHKPRRHVCPCQAPYHASRLAY